MYRRIGEGTLSSGEGFEIGVVEVPDPEWAERLVPFLIHKGGDWNYHVRSALAAPLDGLATRFYVAQRGGQLISQVMIVGARGIGILAHVFTAPAWRRRGAYRQLMAAQMADCRQLGYRILTLSTGYNSHPYWIYHSFGFRPLAEGSGDMQWLAEPGDDCRFLAPAPAQVRALDWADWAAYSFATLRPVAPGEALPRSPALGVRARGSVEGPFITFRRRLLSQPRATSRVLESASGAVVGWCHVVPGPALLGDAWLLDWNVLPGFAADRPALLAAITWPDAAVVYASTLADPDAEAMLAEQGFRPVVTLARGVINPDATAGHGDVPDEQATLTTTGAALRLWLRE